MSTTTETLAAARSTGTRPPARPRRRQSPWKVVLTTGFLGLVALYFLLPLWWLVVASSRETAAGGGGGGLWFSGPFGLVRNVGDVLGYDDGIFVRWLLNSFAYALFGATLGTLFASMAGFALAKYVFPGRDAVFNVILAGVLVPATALALPLFLLFGQVEATDTMWAVLLPSTVSPFGVYLCRIYAAAAVPEELLEAARLDGASEFRAFFSVAVRLMGPALVTVFLFQFVVVWNNFLLPLVMLQDSRLYPVTLGLATWNSQVTRVADIQLYVIVGSLLSIVPLVVAFLALQRFWRAGLSEGAVK